VWAERGAADCCVVVWQISVGVESCDTAEQVWLITPWSGAKWAVAGGNLKLRMILGRKKWKIGLILSLIYILIHIIYLIYNIYIYIGQVAQLV
jgi:hypothetical protein